MICRCIEERQEFLQSLAGVQEDQERLHTYLQGVETMLREMELSQDPDIVQLKDQTRRILVSLKILFIYLLLCVLPNINLYNVWLRVKSLDTEIKNLYI